MKTLFTSVIAILFAAICTTLLVIYGQQSLQNNNVGAVIPQTPPVFDTVLATQFLPTDTTMYLQSASTTSGVSLTGYNCFTVDTNSPNLEYICGTMSGTNVVNLVRNINPLTGTTTLAATPPSHRTGADVRITDFPALTIVGNILNGTESISNPIYYASNFTPSFWTAAASNTVATIGIVNSTAAAGCGFANTSASGCVQIPTAAQVALGTILGSTGANLVIPNSSATSTPSATTPVGSVPASGSIGGKISQLWLDLTKPFTFSGLLTSSGGFNSTATTTISGSSAVSNALNLNGVNLAFPSSVCGNETSWIWNGSGTASCGVLPTARYVFGTTTPITAINGNVSSASDSFPAGSITSSSTITFQGDINCSASAGTPNCGFILEDSAGNSYLTVTATTPSAGTCVFPFNATIVSTSSSGQISDAVVVSNCASANAFHDNSSAATTFFNTSSITGYKVVLTSSNVAMTTSLTNLIMVVNP